MREMKDSGVAWLGDIDSRFDIKAIGNLFTIKKDIIGREPDRVLSITQRGIKIKDTTSNEGQNAASYAHYQIVNVGDFAMNHMDLLTGWVDISRYEGVTSPDYRVFTLTDNTQIPEYFLRVFQMYYSNRVFYAFGQGAANLGRWRLPRENFIKIAIPCPPVELQRKIVDEIAAKVSKVDALIVNQQAQIEKLKQYKQSLITEVVTKGLDPNASMKDSGNDYLGQIPAHWKAIKIKYLCSMQAGRNLISEQISDSGDYPVYGGNGLRGYFAEPNYIGECLLVGRQGALCGNVHHVSGEFWATEHAVITEPKEGVSIRYLFYLLTGMNLNLYVSPTAAQPGLSVSTIQNVISCLAPVDEQEQIVKLLDEKIRMIESLLQIKEKKIESLTNYKKSVIYEYVTGKKEVI